MKKEPIRFYACARNENGTIGILIVTKQDHRTRSTQEWSGETARDFDHAERVVRDRNVQIADAHLAGR